MLVSRFTADDFPPTPRIKRKENGKNLFVELFMRPFIIEFDVELFIVGNDVRIVL